MPELARGPKVQHCTAVVLAGGKGSRIATLYPNLPKPLIPAAQKPFLHWVTAWLAGEGSRDIVYSTGYLGEQIEQWVAALERPDTLKLRCRREGAELGTGGGLINCLDLCADWILALNGDSLIATGLEPFFELADRTGADGVLMGIPVEDASRFGTLRTDSSGILQEFSEKCPGKGVINGGVYLFRRALLEPFAAHEKLSLEYDVLPSLIRSGARLAVYQVRNVSFLDIGTPETAGRAGEFIEGNASSFRFPIS